MIGSLFLNIKGIKMRFRRIKSIGLSVAALLIYSSLGFAGFVEFYHQKKLFEQQAAVAPDSVRTGHFKQYVDHDNPSAGVFKQRYYIDEMYGKDNNAPVFLYICGESECNRGALSGAIRVYAKKYHAKLVALEHRYYGKSLPANKLSTNNLQHLSTNAALNDLDRFQNSMRKSNHWTGKWVAFGGSYPGSLAAYYRLKYPENVVGSLASSAPVMAKEEFYEYDNHVTTVTGKECSTKIRQVVAEMEQALLNPDRTRFEGIKKSFGAEEIKNDIDFLYFVADIAADAVQYGHHTAFCSELTKLSNPLEAYAQYTRSLLEKWGVSAVDLTAEGAMSEDDSSSSMRQWLYQSCTEYGYWQIAHPDSGRSTRSGLIDLPYHHQICKRLFGKEMIVNTAGINEQFYYPLFNSKTTNIYFSNGSNDPWSNLSLTDKNGNTNNPNLTYTLIKDSAHCDDLRTPKANDSQALKKARGTMDRLLSKWLKD